MSYRALFLACAWLLAAGGAAAAEPARNQDGGVESLRQTGEAFASVARAVSPSVVFIQVEGSAPQRRQQSPFGPGSPFSDEFFRRFFGEPFSPQQPEGGRPIRGQGSGFAFKTDAGDAGRTYIMTNNHVVENADTIMVRLEDGRELEGQVVGTDPQSDVAVIAVEAEGDIPTLSLGTSRDLSVGEWVVAIGSPFGLRSSLTVGVVSATGRTGVGITDYEDFIQTDAAINPGNSGGPLVDLDGHVVGMNTAIFSRSGGYMGIGFAIPIDLAGSIASQLITDGSVTRGFLGVAIQDLTPELAESFDIDRNEGILVAEVSQDSPAAEAGIQGGDVIVAYEGREVSNAGDFRNRVALTQPGTETSLTVLRDGERRELSVTIGTLSESSLAQQSTGTSREVGLAVEDVTPEIAERLGIRPGQGVVVAEVAPGSPADAAGLGPGAVILEVNRAPVTNVDEFYQALENSPNQRALLLVRSRDAQVYVVMNW
ncbi:MAG: DegQ family serine endoprotease [Pseudomonadota bacterium]